MDGDRIIGFTSLIILLIQSIVVFVGNGFITGVIGYLWLQSKKMVPCDLLLVSLAVSRFLLNLVVTISHIYYSTVMGISFSIEREDVLALCWIFFVISNLCCNTWLNFFYCVKVSNYGHPFMLWLKNKIDFLVAWLLGGSLILFTITYLSVLVIFFRNKTCCNHTEMLVVNSSNTKVCSSAFRIFNPLILSSAFINFCLCITATGILLISLWKHIQNLKKSGTATNDMSTWAHTSALKHLMFFFVSYVLYFSFMIVSICGFLTLSQDLNLFIEIMMSFYPSIHTVVLILSNPKLRKVFSDLLKIRKC